MSRTSDRIRYGPRRRRRAKGKAEFLVTFEALGVARRDARTGGGTFVDRYDTLAMLERELRGTVQDGRSRVVVLTGEPGIGKSRRRRRARRVAAAEPVPGRPVRAVRGTSAAVRDGPGGGLGARHRAGDGADGRAGGHRRGRAPGGAGDAVGRAGRRPAGTGRAGRGRAAQRAGRGARRAAGAGGEGGRRSGGRRPRRPAVGRPGPGRPAGRRAPAAVARAGAAARAVPDPGARSAGGHAAGAGRRLDARAGAGPARRLVAVGRGHGPAGVPGERQRAVPRGDGRDARRDRRAARAGRGVDRRRPATWRAMCRRRSGC